MPEYRTEIEIAASKDIVWDVLSDFAAYPTWNPFLVRIEGKPEPGATLRLSVKMGVTFPVDVRVVFATPGRQLRWAGPPSQVAGVFVYGEHYFVIQELTPDRVRFVHGEEFTGVLTPFIGWWLERQLMPAYQACNEALKARAEELARGRRTAG